MLPFFFLFFSCRPLEQTTLPFKYDDFILVNVTINDTLSGNMIFDTGSNHTIIYKKLVEFDKSTKSKEAKITDLYGNIDKIIYSRVKKFTIGNQYLNNVKIRFHDLNNIYTKNKIIGILGTDIISKYSWAFDFKSNELKISSIKFKNKNLIELNVDYKRKSLIKESLKISNKQIDSFILDTGCLCQVNLNSINKPDLKFNTQLNLFKSIVGKEEIYEIDFANLGKISYKSHEIDSVQIQSSKKFKNLLGLDLFKKETIVVDGVSNKFYYSGMSKFKNNNTNEIGLRFGIKEDDIIVNAIIKNSVSYRKGINLGDKITMLNNKTFTVSHKTLDSINDNKKNIKNITIKRKEEILEFSF